ncbi:helix-hairpin-helix domain-containing protein [Longimicrobium sp.]|uniref:helix-hairpin-helix domain-containing protein n=1 Tax=Longimicrobium sp. TaxID=2029185 RepID=UPI002D040E4C|nr:hypothetical protein [Longimicrobium sp.]HSU16358.1 hypothetical protein [Longimicrobium sp.]
MPKKSAGAPTEAPAKPAARTRAGVDPNAAHVAPSPADPPEIAADTLSPRARRASAARKAEPQKGKKGDGKAKKPGNLGAAGFERRPKGPDLRGDLRAFVTARPAGWGHDDWVAFLDHLRERGHDTTDPDAIGLLLERERLAALLERVPGMGPRRIDAVVGRYDTIWSAHQAGVDDLAALPNMTRALAEKVRQALQ